MAPGGKHCPSGGRLELSRSLNASDSVWKLADSGDDIVGGQWPKIGQTEPLIYLVQPRRSIRSSDVVTLSRPPSSYSLKVNNRSFRHTSPCLWNQLPKE